MTKIECVRKLLETFFNDKIESNVKEMKQYVDERMGETFNENTFYTIINKLKKSGCLEPYGKRGSYRWIVEKTTEYTDNYKDEMEKLHSFNALSRSGEVEIEDVKHKSPELERTSIRNIEQSLEWNPVLKGKDEKMESALSFVKQMVSFLNIDERYYDMIDNPYPIDPWSITPELSESIQILRTIAEGKKRLDDIILQNDKGRS